MIKTTTKARTCRCKAYPWPHRTAGGLCRYPDPPAETYARAAAHAPVGMRRRSAIRRRLLERYALHPIRDRALIRRWLPKLYVAWCRRQGLDYPDAWLGGYVPALRVTADGPRSTTGPAPGPYPAGYRFGNWYNATFRKGRKTPLRSVVRRQQRRPAEN